MSVTASVEGALQLLDENRWDVVVTDIGMPRAQRLRSHSPSAGTRQSRHVIAVTAFDTPEHRRQILRHGFAYHLTKPFDPNHLLAVVSETVGTGAMHQIN